MSSEILGGLRMLDLTDEKGAICGKMFADLGADVIKIEPPEGCPTRRIEPFISDMPDRDSSAYFLAYQAGKRSVTLNLESADGRALLIDLIKKADFLVESFPLGHLDSLGLGYDEMSKINPRLIYTSITPFGDTGPAKDWKAADIVSWASGGMMYLMGDQGRPPLQCSMPQANLHAGAEAAVASFIAHFPRERDGFGQKIVIDTQACVVWTLMNEQAYPILHGDYLRRTGVYSGSADVARKVVFRCADGHISITVTGGNPTFAESTKKLVNWMAEKGMAPDWLKEIDWMTWTPASFASTPQPEFMAQVKEIEKLVESFFMTMSRREIYHEALKRRILLAPVATVEDIANDEQLESRQYFQKVSHPAAKRDLVLPGPFVKYGVNPIGAPRPAPRLGEHNHEVYSGLLGLDAQRLADLYATGTI